MSSLINKYEQITAYQTQDKANNVKMKTKVETVIPPRENIIQGTEQDFKNSTYYFQR